MLQKPRCQQTLTRRIQPYITKSELFCLYLWEVVRFLTYPVTSVDKMLSEEIILLAMHVSRRRRTSKYTFITIRLSNGTLYVQVKSRV